MKTWYKNVRSQLLEQIIFKTKPIISLIYKPPIWQYTQEDLRHFPAHTLGHQMAQALDRNGYQLVAHYEAHDAKHLVLSYPMTAEGEVLMQFFLFGNGNRFVSVVATMIVGTVLMPDQWTAFYQAFRRGHHTPVNVSLLNYEHLLLSDLATLQESIFSPAAISVLA